MSLKNLQPGPVWDFFAQLNAIPRASKKEEQVIDFTVNFGRSLGLETLRDATGNVLIRKPALKGFEKAEPVALQAHLDMVHQKNRETRFDFDSEGIRMLVDGDWVRAEGTTLGADNGIGVAAIMAVLADNTLRHPPLEALFTIDEETGMTGAKGLQGGWLKAKYLLNLDTEMDDEIDIGCAGGIDVTASRQYEEEATPSFLTGLEIRISGLRGGHSGMDIHRGYGNANKIMARMLLACSDKVVFRLSLIDGGSLRNAIPRECRAVLAVSASDLPALTACLAEVRSELLNEWKVTEPDLVIATHEADRPERIMEEGSSRTILRLLNALHNGVYRMSADIPDLVQTSNNVARVLAEDGRAEVACLARSSVESSKMDMAMNLKSCFELAGFEVTLSGSYPGWTPDVHAPLLNLLVETYRKMNASEPRVVACHAGLECGLLGQHYPGMQMISFGPTIIGAHSPDERVNIPSVGKFWKLLCEVLAAMPGIQK
jgi:dipeptidase D